MKRLKQLAENSQMFPNPSVSAEHSVVIDATKNDVWSTLTDVEAWPNWYGYLAKAEISGSFQTGSMIQYGGFLKHKANLGKVREQDEVVLYGTFVGLQGLTRWLIEEVEPGKTKVTFRESIEARIGSLIYSDEKMEVHLKKWLSALKVEVEK